MTTLPAPCAVCAMRSPCKHRPSPPPDNLDGGAQVLDDVAAFVGRFVVFPTPHALTAVTLWAAHTWTPEKTWYVTPRLVLDSAEPGSGKTRVLELLALLVRAPEMTISATVAAIFRMIADNPITLLFDEVDAIFNPKNGGNYEDLRALLNAGYKQGATIARCVGDAKQMKVQRFDVFAPVALAGLAGKMPGTITTRAVTVHMRRRAPGEKVQPFRERDAELEAGPLRVRLAEWVDAVATDLALARPDMPEGVEDRPAEVWEALLAVADAAGGEWLARGRAACAHFVLNSDPGELSFGVRLLRDVHAVLRPAPTEQEPHPEHRDRIPSAELVAALVALVESPWADLWGKPLDQRRLAAELGRYGVKAKPIKMPDGKTPRGYLVTGPDGLLDAWQRYLPDSGATGATSATAQVDPVADGSPVALTSATDDASATAHSPLTSRVAPVAPVAPQNGPADASGDSAAVNRTEPRREPLRAEHEPSCEVCGQRLLLTTPGRTLCARCAADSKESA